jgi:phage tail P2-like protein
MSETWTEAQKRAVIAASVATHKRKGTIGALKRALAALGYEVVVDEDTGIRLLFGWRSTSTRQGL